MADWSSLKHELEDIECVTRAGFTVRGWVDDTWWLMGRTRRMEDIIIKIADSIEFPEV